MNTRMPIAVTCWLCGLGAASLLSGCHASIDAWNPPDQVSMQDVYRRTLETQFTPDREVIVSMVELPPHTTLERHWHPGEEFHVYLEGKVTIAIDGEESIVGVPGVVGHVPYQKMHTAITGDEGAKLIVFRVHKEGKAVRYLESENAPRD